MAKHNQQDAEKKEESCRAECTVGPPKQRTDDAAGNRNADEGPADLQRSLALPLLILATNLFPVGHRRRLAPPHPTGGETMPPRVLRLSLLPAPHEGRPLTCPRTAVLWWDRPTCRR